MPGRLQPDIDLADAQPLAEPQRLLTGPRRRFAHAGAHDGQRLARGQHRPVAGAGVIGMGVGDRGAVHRAGGIDEKTAGFAEQAGRGGFQPGFGVGHVIGGFQPKVFTPAERAALASFLSRVASGRPRPNAPSR